MSVVSSDSDGTSVDSDIGDGEFWEEQLSELPSLQVTAEDPASPVTSLSSNSDGDEGVQRHRYERAEFFDQLLLYEVSDLPGEAGGCFITDVVVQILLFVPLSPITDLLMLGLVNRQWHFLVNYLPHWSAYRIQKREYRCLLRGAWPPHSVVLRRHANERPPPIRHTQERLLDKATMRKQRLLHLQECRQRFRSKGDHRCICSQLVYFLVYCAASAALGVICWYMGMGFGTTNLRPVTVGFLISYLTVFAILAVLAVLFLMAVCLLIKNRPSGESVANPISRYRRLTLLFALSGISLFCGPLLGQISGRLVSASSRVDAGSVSMAQLGEACVLAPFEVDDSPPGYFELDTPLATGWEVADPSEVAPWDAYVYEDDNKTGWRIITYSEYARSALVTIDYTVLQRRRTQNLCNRSYYTHIAAYGRHSNVSSYTSLSYRVVRPNVYYGTKGARGIEVSQGWIDEENRFWDEYRLHLIDIESPETLSEGQDRVDRLRFSRDVMLLVCGPVLLMWFVASSLRARHMLRILVAAGCFFALLVNPVLLIANGAVCLLNDPPEFMMCDIGRAVALLVYGVIAGCCFAGFLCGFLHEADEDASSQGRCFCVRFLRSCARVAGPDS